MMGFGLFPFLQASVSAWPLSECPVVKTTSKFYCCTCFLIPGLKIQGLGFFLSVQKARQYKNAAPVIEIKVVEEKQCIERGKRVLIFLVFILNLFKQISFKWES